MVHDTTFAVVGSRRQHKCIAQHKQWIQSTVCRWLWPCGFSYIPFIL